MSDFTFLPLASYHFSPFKPYVPYVPFVFFISHSLTRFMPKMRSKNAAVAELTLTKFA